MLKNIKPLLVDAETLELSGSGDPFASKHYRSIILASDEVSKAKFAFHTNGNLFDEMAWRDLKLQNRVRDVNISVDAATKETYDIVRRGGNFERLKKNLGFLKSMREENQIDFLGIGFVVQAINFCEMPAFVQLGKEFGVDSVYFSLIRDWGCIKNFTDAQVWDQQHPKYDEFLSVLSDKALLDPIVNLGDVSGFTNSPL